MRVQVAAVFIAYLVCPAHGWHVTAPSQSSQCAETEIAQPPWKRAHVCAGLDTSSCQKTIEMEESDEISLLQGKNFTEHTRGERESTKRTTPDRQLPSFEAGEKPVAETGHSPEWWVQVHEKVFYTPHSLLGLSQNISDYYYMIGSESALTDKMKEHRVGGAGRWHIMHLPQGTSMIQTSDTVLSGDRRWAFSVVKQLVPGKVLSSTFPAYELNPDYKHPLGEHEQEIEKKAAKGVTSDSVKDFLKRLVAFPTRSYLNEYASGKVEHFLEGEFKKMGYKTCSQSFSHSGRILTNIIAHIPGETLDSMTVGAHYDSRPYAGAAPGAEDNGSGVATLLAIAQSYSKHLEAKPKKNIYFVAFSAEEPGLLGSQAFASSLEQSGNGMPEQCKLSSSFLRLASKKKVKSPEHAAIILDEVGWLSKSYPKPTVNLESYDTTKPLMDHLRHSSHMHNGKSLEVEHSNHPFGSDHMSFLNKGFMAVLTINSDDEAYPNYHQSSDTIENVNTDYAAQIGKMNIGALIRMVL